MEKGTLSELVLTRTVTKHIKKQNKKFVSGTGVGCDFSELQFGEAGLYITEGTGENPFLAWSKALNNFSCSGGELQGVRITILLPEDVAESEIKDYMKEIYALSEEYQIQILGGHTKISSSCSGTEFVVTALGTAEQRIVRDKVCPGDDIVMVGYAGCYGTDLLAKRLLSEKTENATVTRMSESYIRSAQVPHGQICIYNNVKSIPDGMAKYIHDISYGGVYGALSQLATHCRKGIRVDGNRIPIRQETIELCEHYGKNPYMLEGTGAFLAVSGEENRLAEKLRELGLPAEQIGKITEDNNRIVVHGHGETSNERHLMPIKSDDSIF